MLGLKIILRVGGGSSRSKIIKTLSRGKDITWLSNSIMREDEIICSRLHAMMEIFLFRDPGDISFHLLVDVVPRMGGIPSRASAGRWHRIMQAKEGVVGVGSDGIGRSGDLE